MEKEQIVSKKIDTNEFKSFELDLFEQGLDLLEAKLHNDREALKKIHLMAGEFEKGNKNGEHAEIIARIKSEIGLAERKFNSDLKVDRERIVLLKAKLILLQQSLAADAVFNGDDEDNKKKK